MASTELCLGQFVAFNDQSRGPSTAANATTWDVFGNPPGSSGPLKDINTGAVLPVWVTITATPGVVPVAGGLCVNFFAISLIEAMAENLTFAEAIGASRPMVSGLLAQVFAQPALKQYAERLAARKTGGGGGFAMTAGMKDVSLMLDEAR